MGGKNKHRKSKSRNRKKHGTIPETRPVLHTLHSLPVSCGDPGPLEVAKLQNRYSLPAIMTPGLTTGNGGEASQSGDILPVSDNVHD